MQKLTLWLVWLCWPRGLGLILAKTGTDSTALRRRWATALPWEGCVGIDGVCYLKAIDLGSWDRAYLSLGIFPRYQQAKQWMARGARFRRTGKAMLHCCSDGLATPYRNERVGGKRQRHRRLLNEIRAGLPACSALGDGRYTTDYEVLQPVGSWKMENGLMIHEGEFLNPIHPPSSSGWCYLSIFQPRYQTVAEGRLGRWPRTRSLQDFSRENPNFLIDGKFELQLRVVSGFIRAHIEGTQSTSNQALSAMEILDLVPRHKTCVGGRSPKESYAIATKGYGYKSLDQYDATLLDELVNGKITCTPLGGGRYTSDHDVLQSWGKWEEIDGKMYHTGTYHHSLHSPTVDGFCYLLCFYPRYRAVAQGRLGKYPDASLVRRLAMTNTHWLDVRPMLRVEYDVNPSREWAPTITHVVLDTKSVFNGASIARWGLKGHVGGITRGLAGSYIDPPALQPGAVHVEDGFYFRAEGTIGRPDQGKLRSAEYKTYHNVHPAVVDSAKGKQTDFDENPRFSRIFDVADAAFAEVSATWRTGDKVVVTGWPWGSNAVTSKHPGETVRHGVRGLVFCSEASSGYIHPAWDVIELPLQPTDGRLLATIRLLPLVAGRSDVDICIVNARVPEQHLTCFECYAFAGTATLTSNSGWAPVWFGGFAAQGAVWGFDKAICRSHFAKFADVYGADEIFAYVRNPICLPNRALDGVFDCMTLSDTIHDVAYFPPESSLGDKIWRCHTAKTWTVRDLVEGSRGKWRPSVDIPSRTVNHFRNLFDLQGQAEYECARANIPILASDRALSRRGHRYAHTQVSSPSKDSTGYNFIGGIWRPYDVAFGARSRLRTDVTQGLDPRLWPLMTHPDDRIKVNEEVLAALTKGQKLVEVYATNLEAGICVAVAAVATQRAMTKFRSARREFDHWIWLTENNELTCVDEKDVVVHLPRWYGVGFHFQLARLIPATAGRHDVFFSCVNDLETDWMPRSERLAAGRQCMPYYDMVFPAMGLNCPCPFQDVYGRMDALSAHPAKLESWRRVVASLGFLYGIDEVWSAAWGFPTVAVRWELGAGATPNFRNPRDNLVLRQTDEGLKGYVASRGNFFDLFHGSPSTFEVTPIGKDRDVAGIVRNKIPKTIGGAAWDMQVRHDVAEKCRNGYRHIAIFVWGTRGDRVPLQYAASELRKGGIEATIVELNTTSEGKAGLEECEKGNGLSLTPHLLHSSQIVARTATPNLAPVYLWSGGKSLSYDLAPNPKYGGSSRGGLPWYVDWLVPLVTAHWTRHIRIGAYRGTQWFPRSADGISPLPRKVDKTKRAVRRGRVGGSSSIPVPKEYQDWEEIPSGDHLELFRNYTEVACAGGAGVVQTIAMAGARAVAWDNSIDRQYSDPTDAGRGVDGNEAGWKWRILIPYFYPSYSKILHPRVWWAYMWFKVSTVEILRTLWQLLFIAYSFRKWHIMPTIESTISRNLLGTSHPLFALLLARLIHCLWVAWGEATGKGVNERIWLLSKQLFAGVTSSCMSFLALCGASTRLSIVLSTVYASLPSPAATIANIRFGRLSVGESRSVWCGLTVVWYKSVPVGLHATLYSPETGVLYQGVHKRGAGLGTSFVAHTRKCAFVESSLWLQTSLLEKDLAIEKEVSGMYSAWFNCQMVVVTKLYTSGAAKTTPLISLLIIGLATGHAFLALTLASLVVAAIGSMGALATLMLTPLFPSHPELGEWCKVIVKAASKAVTPWFGGVTDDDDEEAKEDLSDITKITEAVVILTTEAIRSGVDQDTAFEAASSSIITSLADYGATDQTEPVTKEDTISSVVERLKTAGVPQEIVSFVVRGSFTMFEQAWEVGGFFTNFFAFICSQIESQWGVVFLPDLARGLEHFVRGQSQSIRQKNAWAPLFGKHLDRLRPVDWLSAGIEEWKEQDYDDPLHRIIQNLNEFCPAGQDPLDLQQTFIRKSRLPFAPRASEQEFAKDSLLHSVSTVIDPMLETRAKKYLALGGKQGIDGMWLATDEERDRVNARYLPSPRPTLPQEEQLADAVAECLYDNHPDAFSRPGVVSPETVRNQLVKKYSPGLPLLARFKRRSDLIKTGWMDAVIQATYRRLELGEYPPQAYHEFAKMQIVTKLRTVVAQDLASYFVDQVVQLERNKRPFWLQANMGMGAPLRTGYLGTVFEAVNSRQTRFSADITAYDANTPPVIFHILTRLAEKGVKDGGIPMVEAVLRKKYVGMQNAVIVDLPTGKVVPKNRGGGTGQSSTSWDNHWGMRAAMIMIWSVVSNKPPSEFYITNSVHNTGDDNIWGTDDDLDPDDLSRVAKEWLGLDLRVEGRGDITDLTYLGKIPKPSIAIPERGRLPLPTFVAAPLREQFLLRRSAVNSRVAGLPPVKYYEKLVERSIGHAQNCAFDQEMYSLVAHEYMEEASSYLGKNVPVIWRVKSGGENLVEGVSLRIPHGTHLPPKVVARLERLRKDLRLPTYTSVINKDAQAPPKIKGESKFAYATVPIGWERLMRASIATARVKWNSWIPDSLVKLAGKSDMAPVAPLFWVLGYPVETFVWRTMVSEDGEIPSLDTFAFRCRKSPFSAATDPVNFSWWIEKHENQVHVLNQDYRSMRGRMMVAFLWYYVIDLLYGMATQLPLVGLAVEMSKVWRFDIPRLFSVLSSFYWLDTADSSAIISAMMPSDPFGFEKKCALWMAALTPYHLCIIIGGVWPISWVSTLSNLVGKVTTITRISPFKRGDAVPTNRWQGSIVNEVMTKLSLAGNRGLVISAPTATGKSTQFPAALIQLTSRRVWLVVPRIVLRTSYNNPWIDGRLVLKASRGVKLGSEPLVVCTYGHLNARVTHGSELSPEDIVLFDEFHEEEPEMGASAWYLRDHPLKGYLSATPSTLYAPNALKLSISLERPYEEPVPIRLALPIVQLFQKAAQDHPQEIKRSLVIVSSLKECDMVAASITSMGYACSTLNRLNRRVPPYGVIVATQIVDSGIDIDPPVNIVVDAGERIVSSKGFTFRQPSDASTDVQRRGRAGRRGKGWSYTTLHAGTGSRPIAYPSYTRVVGDENLRKFLFSTLGIEDQLDDLPNAVRFDKRVLFPPAESGFQLVGLAAWWLLINSEGTATEAGRQYDQISFSGWSEQHDGVRNLLLNWFGTCRIPSRSLICDVVSEPAFTVSIGGVRRVVSRLTIQDGKVDGV
nr:TPA_asm: polyprotein [Hypovirus sp.]